MTTAGENETNWNRCDWPTRPLSPPTPSTPGNGALPRTTVVCTTLQVSRDVCVKGHCAFRVPGITQLVLGIEYTMHTKGNSRSLSREQ
jgi:hypothetical protein